MFYKAKQKTLDYREYQDEIRDTVTFTDGDKFAWPFNSESVHFTVHAGLSNRGADLDNVLKPLLDTYQSMYEDFNDNKVYRIDAHKEIVKKGDEYLEVTIELYKEKNKDG